MPIPIRPRRTLARHRRRPVRTSTRWSRTRPVNRVRPIRTRLIVVGVIDLRRIHVHCHRRARPLPRARRERHHRWRPLHGRFRWWRFWRRITRTNRNATGRLFALRRRNAPQRLPAHFRAQLRNVRRWRRQRRNARLPHAVDFPALLCARRLRHRRWLIRVERVAISARRIPPARTRTHQPRSRDKFERSTRNTCSRIPGQRLGFIPAPPDAHFSLRIRKLPTIARYWWLRTTRTTAPIIQQLRRRSRNARRHRGTNQTNPLPRLPRAPRRRRQPTFALTPIRRRRITTATRHLPICMRRFASKIPARARVNRPSTRREHDAHAQRHQHQNHPPKLVHDTPHNKKGRGFPRPRHTPPINRRDEPTGCPSRA